MNERTNKLYQEASEFAYKICKEQGREGGTSDHIWNALSTGRFAELIVKECASIVDTYGRWILYDKLAVKLKKEFGIEE